jgi:hypothetical protein
MRYYRSQWENALSDLKDAAHDAGIAYEVTDAWSVAMPDDVSEPATLGYYDAAGDFQPMAWPRTPDALRTLRKLYRTDAPTPTGPTMATTEGDAIMVDGAPRVVTAVQRTTYHGVHGLSVAHISPDDVHIPTAAAHALVTHVTAPQVATRCDVCGAELVREDCPNYGNGAEHAAPDVRAFPV